jgi:ubiquitin-protein ligase
MAGLFARLRAKKQALMAIYINSKKKRYQRIIKDAVSLGADGWDFDAEKESFTKDIIIEEGLYPGTYRCTIIFPDKYPLVPPKITAQPIDRDEDFSSHHLRHDGFVCIGDPNNNSGDHKKLTWWRSDVNITAVVRIIKQIASGKEENFSNQFGKDRIYCEEEYTKLIDNFKKKAGMSLWDLIAWFNEQQGISIPKYIKKNQLGRYIQELPSNIQKKVYVFYDQKRKEHEHHKIS